MQLLPVYDQQPITLAKGVGSRVFDDEGKEYLDFYSGHGVISIGHSHPYYVEKLQNQLREIGFYSNAIRNRQADELAEKLGEISGCEDFNLFLCNSGAEANENAFKVASFANGRRKIIAFEKSFHGRTALACAAGDVKNRPPVNESDDVVRVPLNDFEAIERVLDRETCAVIVEGIQGIGGIHVPQAAFLQHVKALCEQNGAVLILDEIQSGFGRSGKFFAFQHMGIEPDLITMAKGMGNGFPVGGLLAHKRFHLKQGALGTTFGGNYLACQAALAVIEVLKSQELMANAEKMGNKLMAGLKGLAPQWKIRGIGLMIGIEADKPVATLRQKLLVDEGVFTGSSSNPNIVRLLPPLCVSEEDCDLVLQKFANVLDTGQ
jgi:acetylornithine aminotransferase